jgi:hypothetical protein
MRILASVLSLAICCAASLPAAQVSRHVPKSTAPPTKSAAPLAPANLEGKMTVYMLAGNKLDDFPLNDVEVYLFTLEQSKPLQELQRRCKQAMRRSGIDATAIYEVCRQSEEAAADLVPKLPRAGFTRTDRSGAYRFPEIASGQRYHVVGLKYEAGDPVLMVGVTPRLKPGESCSLDISENNPWVDAVPEAK